MSALTLLGGCFLVIGEIPEGSDSASGGDSSALGGSAGAGASGGISGSSGSSGGGQGGAAGSSGASGASGAAGAAAAGGVAGGDGSAGSAGASGCVSTCDCDGDLQAGPQCSGPDCVDNDPLVFQGQGGWFGVANAAGGFDYNCDTSTDKEFQNVTCPGLLSALDCNNKPEGYLVDKPCGEMTDWGDCTWNGIALQCEPNTKQSKQVRCH